MSLKHILLLLILMGFYSKSKAQDAIPFVCNETEKYYLHFYIQEQAESDDYIPQLEDKCQTGKSFLYAALLQLPDSSFVLRIKNENILEFTDIK